MITMWHCWKSRCNREYSGGDESPHLTAAAAFSEFETSILSEIREYRNKAVLINSKGGDTTKVEEEIYNYISMLGGNGKDFIRRRYGDNSVYDELESFSRDQNKLDL